MQEMPDMMQQGQEVTDGAPMQDDQAGSFSIDSQQIESAIKDQMDDKQAKNLDIVLKKGNELIFGKETHYQLMDSLKDSQDVGKDLGSGAAGLMASLIKSSGNSIPGDVVIPAGIILLARAAEFVNKSGMNTITDDDFEEAAHVFNTHINNAFNPEFRERMKQSAGEQQPEQPVEQAQMQAPQGGGLLQQSGG